MSQEYTEDKEVTLRKLSSGRRLLEALLIIVAIFAIYLMVALVSFNPSDPSWSQTAWHEPIHNLGGGVGAWLADTLLFIFGVLAYAIPPIMIVLCWAGFRQRQQPDFVDYFGLSLRLIGTLALVITSCGLAALNIDDLYYFASGGVIGSLLVNALKPLFNNSIGATLSLLCVWAAGLTLFTGWSWLVIAERIGGVVLGVATFATNRSRDNNRYRDDEYDDEDEQTEQQDVLVAPAAVTAPAAAAVTSAVAAALPEVAQADAEDPLLTPSAPLVEHNVATQPAATPAEVAAASAVTPVVLAPTVAAPRPAEPPVSEAITLNTQWDNQSTPAPATLPRAPAEATIAPSPPVYRFEVPEQQTPVQAPVTSIPSLATSLQPTPAAPARSPFDFSAAQRDADDELLGSIPSFSATSSSNDTAARTAASVAAAAATHTFMPAFSATSDANSQVKQGLGPELPRPNRVRIPTRRELASYGIKLPSQRLAEQQQREQSEPTFDMDLPSFATPEVPFTEEQEDQQAMEQLSRDFAQQQQQRYAEPSEAEISMALEPEISAEDQAAEAEMAALSQAFAAQQQARYQSNPQSAAEEPTFGFSAVDDEEEAAPYPEQSYRQPAAPTQSYGQPAWQPTAAPEPQYSAAPAFAPAESAPVAPTKPEQAWIKPQEPDMDSLIHPFLMRNEPRLERPTTKLPTLELLTPAPTAIEPVDMFALEQKARLIEASLADYRVKADVVDTLPGPVITRFELDLAPGVKAARISNLSRDLARSLSTSAVRVVEVIPGKPYVGLELPNIKRQTVYLREVLDCPAFRDNPSPLAIVLGKDISGEPVVADLAKMPHLLVAGTTGSGKSVGVNAMILSILYKATPKEVRFIMIDPKMLELSVYEGIPHLLTDVVTDMKDAANALRWCVGEMERRYKLMSALGVRNLAGYNERVDQAEAMGRPIPDPFWKPTDGMGTTHPTLEKEPYIVVMVDEFADLMMTVGKKVEELIARLAQKARAAGIHLVLATQRPSVDVITGLIKANIPTRIAFTVSSKIDSRTILDQGGAESLLGMGDMLYLAPNSSIPVRVHGAFVRDQEVHAVVSDWKARERPQYKEGILSAGEDGEGGAAAGAEGGEELDPLFDQAVAFVVDKRRASISGVQRQFRIGYNRAARIIEQMELQGIVSEQGHNGNREVLAQHHPD